MSIRRGLVTLAVVAFVAVSAIVAQQPAKPNRVMTANEQAMFAVGQALLPRLLASNKNPTPFDKAKYAFATYCDTLANNNIPVNDDAWNRFQNLVRNGDSGRWTCGDHTKNLGAIFEGMGIRDVVEVEAYAGFLDNHGAPAVVYQGKLCLFDAWQLAHSGNGTYAGSASSKWNCMSMADWEAEMKRQRYVSFSRDQEHYFKTLYEAVKGLDVSPPATAPPATAPPPPPSNTCPSDVSRRAIEARAHNAAQNPAGSVSIRAMGMVQSCIDARLACDERAKAASRTCRPDATGRYTACIAAEYASNLTCAQTEIRCTLADFGCR